ncbi:MAG: DUF2380 domain-containing protein [Candidatus Sericytochromatia bacterium]|nr:DUF2380 domain-containing protein [Candidatus Sericytochromatia bacterium]
MIAVHRKNMTRRSLSLLLTASFSLGLALPVWAGPPTDMSQSVPTQSIQTGRNLAVVDFENHTGDKRFDNLKRGLSESLSSKLARRPELKLVERSQLDKAVKELGFAQSVYASATEAKEIGKMAGADVIVTGALVKAGTRLELTVRVIDVETAQIIVADSYDFQSENDTLLVMDYLSLLIPQKLGLYVSDRELDMARNRLRAQQMAKSGDNNWIWWTVGGVAVAVAIGVGVALATRPNVSQEVIIGGR